jgi:hypothetical protein
MNHLDKASVASKCPDRRHIIFSENVDAPALVNPI